MAAWHIQRLAKRHDRTQFNCGQPLLDDWLRQRAGQFDRKDLARTYVAVRGDSPRVFGYYALASHRVVHEVLPAGEAQGLPRLDVPVVLLARLAVDRTVQRQGLGELLLVDALRRSLWLGEQLGIRAVEVDALDDDARAFYRKYGFAELLDDPRHPFMSLHVIRKLDLPPLG